MPVPKVDYLRKCLELAKYHWAVSVTSLILFAYSLISDYGALVALPDWMKTEKWPKLPLPWAVAIVFAALFFIVLEGGFRLHRETLKQLCTGSGTPPQKKSDSELRKEQMRLQDELVEMVEKYKHEQVMRGLRVNSLSPLSVFQVNEKKILRDKIAFRKRRLKEIDDELKN